MALALLDGFDRFGRNHRATLRERQELFAGGRERRAACRPFEYRGPDGAFEMPDALTHCRLAHEELTRGAAEAAAPGNGEEHLEVPEVQCHKKSLCIYIGSF